MTAYDSFNHFFKPEVRSRGDEFLASDAVFISIGSDTRIEAYIRGSGAAKVTFKALSIESETFFADCNCSSSAKVQLCRHIWAVILKVEEKNPDFLSSKADIQKQAPEENPQKMAMKVKQSDYKKQQYEKQKARGKAIRAEKKKALRPEDQPIYPEDVSHAIKFFLENGFAFELPFQEEQIRNAKKKLSRIFHPDIGGSHQESVDLNVNYDVLIRYLQSL